MSDATSPYEQLKADLGYLGLGRAAECFAALADQAKAESWGHVGYLARVMAEQAAATSNRRLASRMRFARFPFRRTVEEFDFDFQPSIDRKVVEDLASLRFIGEGRSVAFLGQPGCGKTHLAVALAIRSVEAGYQGYFSTADDMVVALSRARLEGNWAAKLRLYTAPSVLVIDLSRGRHYPDFVGAMDRKSHCWWAPWARVP
jgi:DNA replication protein DnaC